MAAFLTTLDHVAKFWLQWMWAMSWQVALMGAVILAVALLARKASPRFRYFLWCLVLLKLCLPPNLAFVTGLAQWVLPRQAAEGSRLLEGHASSWPALNHDADATERVPPVSARGVTPESAPAVSVPHAATKASTVAAKPAFHVAWPTTIFGIWFAGVLALILLFVVQYRRMARLLASAQPVTDLTVLRVLEEARSALGIRRRVALVSVAELHSPILFGLFHPRIVLPRRALESLPSDHIRPVLLHELAHLRRRDLWMGFVQLLAQVAYWFHPVVWLANRQLRRERELIVDDIVLAQLQGRRESYSASLLSIVQQGARRGFVTPGYVGIVETPGSLAHRLKRILDANRKPSLRLGWTGFVVLIAMGLVLIPQARTATTEKNAAPLLVFQSLPLLSEEFKNVMAEYDLMPVPTTGRSGPLVQVEAHLLSVSPKGMKEAGLDAVTTPKQFTPKEIGDLLAWAKTSQDAMVVIMPQGYRVVQGEGTLLFPVPKATYVSAYERKEKPDPGRLFHWAPTRGKYEPPGMLIACRLWVEGNEVLFDRLNFTSVTNELVKWKGNLPDAETGKEAPATLDEPVVETLSCRVVDPEKGLRLKSQDCILIPVKPAFRRYASNLRNLDPAGFEAGEGHRDANRGTFIALRAQVIGPILPDMMPDTANEGATTLETAAAWKDTGPFPVTREDLENGKAYRQYDVAGMGWDGGSLAGAEAFVRVIAELTGPENWDVVRATVTKLGQTEPEGGRSQFKTDKEPPLRILYLRSHWPSHWLLVQHTDRVHKMIERILAMLRAPRDMPLRKPSDHVVLAGKVVSSETETPVAKAKVLLFHPKSFSGFFLNCPDDGSFRFTDIPAGKYYLFPASAPGYDLPASSSDKPGDSLLTLELKVNESRTDICFRVKPATPPAK